MSQRRLDMFANRIEAICASHKISVYVRSFTASTHSAVFVVTLKPGHSPQQLIAHKDDIELSLGHRVLIHNSSRREPCFRVRVLGIKP